MENTITTSSSLLQLLNNLYVSEYHKEMWYGETSVANKMKGE